MQEQTPTPPGQEGFVLDDTTSVCLQMRVTEGDKLVAFYGDTNLHEYHGRMIVRAAAGADVEYLVEDFTHDGTRFRVHCFSPTSGGALEPWERVGDRYARRVMSPPADNPRARQAQRFIVIAVCEHGVQTYIDDYPETISDRMGSGNEE